MAEIIAIVICVLIIFAFLLVCFIMVRNANKKKEMREAALKRGRKSAGDLSADQTANESFA